MQHTQHLVHGAGRQLSHAPDHPHPVDGPQLIRDHAADLASESAGYFQSHSDSSKTVGTGSSRRPSSSRSFISRAASDHPALGSSTLSSTGRGSRGAVDPSLPPTSSEESSAGRVTRGVSLINAHGAIVGNWEHSRVGLRYSASGTDDIILISI